MAKRIHVLLISVSSLAMTTFTRRQRAIHKTGVVVVVPVDVVDFGSQGQTTVLPAILASLMSG
jgi:uncharacterized membrane protein